METMLNKAKTLADYTQSLASGKDWGVDDQDILEWLISQAEKAKRQQDALIRIFKLKGCPDSHLMGDAETGIHCGVEDTGCNDRYEGANYGYSCGVENVVEWVENETRDLINSDT